MTRTEAITIIEKAIPSADEETLRCVAELFRAALARQSGLLRELTGRELSLIEQSKLDFRSGRTYSHAETVAYVDEQLERLGVPKSTT